MNLVDYLSSKQSQVVNKKRKHETDENELEKQNKKCVCVPPLNWKQIVDKNLNLSYLTNFLSTMDSNYFFTRLENEIQYFTGDLAKVRVYGKWFQLPRQQCAFGDNNLSYKFSGLTVPATPWTPALLELKNYLHTIVPYQYNFCLVNRYRNGNDSMGEHRDDEKELDSSIPIASVSLGQHRDFIFRYTSKNKIQTKRFTPVKMMLENGSLLLMHPPTNNYWSHSLPPRKKLPGVRINLTFRRIVTT